MVNLRERAESDLKHSLEKEFALPVVLTDPDGVKYDESQNSADPSNPDALSGQILYSYVAVNPDTGEEVIVNNPVVSLRRSSLLRVPVAGETWLFEIPITPSVTADKVPFIMDATRSPENDDSIGYTRYFLTKAEQSV